jgi:hypothetical protein
MEGMEVRELAAAPIGRPIRGSVLQTALLSVEG